MDKSLKPGYVIEAYQNDIWFPVRITKNIKNGKAEITDIKRKSLEYRMAKMRIIKIQGTVVYEVDKWHPTKKSWGKKVIFLRM